MRGVVEELPINEIEVVAFEEEEAGGGGPYEIDVYIDEMLDQYETDDEEESDDDDDAPYVLEHEGELRVTIRFDDYNDSSCATKITFHTMKVDGKNILFQ